MPSHEATHPAQKKNTKSVFANTIRSRSQYKQTNHKNWWFKATNLETLKLIDEFQRPPFTFLQYHVDADNNGRYNVVGFLQTEIKITRSKMTHFINCKTSVFPTTIADKQASDFNKRSDLVSFGIESTSVNKSAARIAYNTLYLSPVHTTVKFNSPPSPTPFDESKWPIRCSSIEHKKKNKPFN